MRAISLLFSILISAHVAWGALADGSHITQSAETLKQWQWAFKPFPGANPVGEYGSFLLNSLSIGLTDNWEIGFVPLAWRSSEGMKMYNVNVRRVWYRNDWWTFSSGVQSNTIDFNYLSSSGASNYKMNIVTFVLANTAVLSPDWRLTHNIALRTSTLKGKGYYIDGNGTTHDLNFDQVAEVYADNYLDLSYTKSLTNVWALGLSRATDSSLGMHMPGATVAWGLGLTHTWNLRRSWISQMSFGVHQMDTGTRRYLFGMAF